MTLAASAHTPAIAPDMFVLEENQRLSDSMLWRLQRNFYREQTIDAWRQSIVPHYVTSNTFIAQAYAKVVFGYIRDMLRDDRQPHVPDEPVYVLELGAGSGRFSYHFLQSFFSMLRQSALRDVAVTFIMSDFSEKNLEFWREHPLLQTYVEQGFLDFALVDLSEFKEIVLLRSGKVLGVGHLKNPLIVLANYVFDSIEQDAFYVGGGQLYESLISLHSPVAEPDMNDPSLLVRVQSNFSMARAQRDYYPEPELNCILDFYQQYLADSHFLMPAQAIRYLGHLRSISNNRLLLISGDKGYSREDDLLYQVPPQIVHHGSISLMVNYHAIGQYVSGEGGVFLTTPHRHDSLHICAAMFDDVPVNQEPSQFMETEQAFREAISQIGPDDYYVLKCFVQSNAEHLSLEQLLAYMRVSAWDAANFWGCYDAFMQHAQNLDTAAKQEISAMAKQVWDKYYPMGEERDLAYALGSLMYEIECYPDAIVYLELSCRLYGENAATSYNIAMCHYNMCQFTQALHYVQQALLLDPAYEPARIMQLTIPAQIRK
ncbi:hypothetical protein ACO0K9_03475 [Undibacterium sp. Ji50W]|uniref:hypothetical protein n=1 Tax=Undibacterium sp. Ji50W TaxID=3413041 RepID=UPI003BF0D5E3